MAGSSKKAVVFDLDGTLVDSLPEITAAANALLAEYDLPALEARVVGGFVGYGVPFFVESLIAATALPARDFDPLQARFLVHYEGVGAQASCFAGAMDVLEALRAQGHPLGLCTNKPEAPLQPVLKVTGLDRFFEVVIAGDTLPQRKPDPAPLRACFDRLGAQGVYVGDSEADAETARRAGVPFLLHSEGIRQNPVEDIPHSAVFSDFAELPALIAAHMP